MEKEVEAGCDREHERQMVGKKEEEGDTEKQRERGVEKWREKSKRRRQEGGDRMQTDTQKEKTVEREERVRDTPTMRHSPQTHRTTAMMMKAVWA